MRVPRRQLPGVDAVSRGRCRIVLPAGRKKKRPPGLDVYLKASTGTTATGPSNAVAIQLASAGPRGPVEARDTRVPASAGGVRSKARDIAEHCIGLIKGGILVTVVSADDRPRVDLRVSVCLATMKSAGEVARAPGGMHRITACGLAWLERVGRPAVDIRPPDELAPIGQSESSGRKIADGDI